MPVLSRHVAALSLVSFLASACTDHKGPQFHVVTAHAQQMGRCIASGGAAITDPAVSATVTDIRVSARSHALNDNAGTFVCDDLLKVVGNNATDLKFAGNGAQTFDLFVEGFYNSPTGYQRIATGSLINVPANTPASSTLPILLYPTERFRCADSRLKTARAFHSATLLPNGNVLIIGGVVASPTDPTAETLDVSERLYLTASTELYDASTGQVTPVADLGPTTLRAFHHATVLNSQPPYQILLVGGITTTDPANEVLAPNSGGLVGRLQNFDIANPPGMKILVTHAAAAEIVTYDPVMGITAHQALPAYDMPGAFQAGFEQSGGGLVTAAGVNYDSNGNTVTVNQIGVQTAADQPRFGTNVDQHLGATLSPVGNANALLWGGGAEPLSMTNPNIGEFLSGIDTGTITSTVIAMQPGVAQTQFHTATALAPDANGTSVLVAGGFVVESTHNNRQAPPANQALVLVNVNATGTIGPITPVTLAGGYTFDPACADSARYRPAGYQAATLLKRGDGNERVLLTGGAHSFYNDPVAMVCNDCDSGLSDVMCALSEASLFNRSSGVQPTVENMQIGRFGHTATVLRDGNVLIAGGIGRLTGANEPRTIGDLEVFNPRLQTPPFDTMKNLDYDDPLIGDISAAGLTRAPGDLARQAGNPKPVKPCGLL